VSIRDLEAGATIARPEETPHVSRIEPAREKDIDARRS
jgi:hypothetical protein